MEYTDLYINGEWRGSGSQGTVGIINPATEEVVMDVPYGGRKEVAEALAPSGNIIGQDIKLGGHRFRVVGVFVPKGEIFGVSMDNYAVVPRGAAERGHVQRHRVGKEAPGRLPVLLIHREVGADHRVVDGVPLC